MAETKVEEDGESSRPRHAASLRRNIASSYLFDQGQSMRDLSTSLEQREHEPDAAALGGPEHEASSRLHQHIRKGECVLRKKLTPIELFLNRDDDAAPSGLARARLRVGRLCEGPFGHAVVFALVVLNAVAMGVEADRHGGRDPFLQRCEHFFFAAFAAEAGLKIFAFGPLYLTDHWNWLDLLILAVMTVDVSAHHASSSASVLVPLRLLRITRLLKLVEACAPLLQMVNALWMGLVQVAWLVLLMIAVLYGYALVCTILYGALGDEAAARFEAQSGMSLDETFGSIGGSMLTLLALMTFENCIDVIRPLGRERASAYVVLFSFMVLCSFGFINMMIAVMSEAFGQFTDPQKVAKLRHERHWRERAALVGEMLFEAIDLDGSGTVSLEELELALATCIDEERQRALSRSERQKMLDIEKYLEMLGLDLDNALSAVRAQTMFYGANLELSPVEFIGLMCRTLDPASKDDVWGVLREVHKIRSHQHAFEQRIEQILEKRLDDLGARLDEVRDEVRRCLPPTAPPAIGATTEGPRDTPQTAPPALGAMTEGPRDTPQTAPPGLGATTERPREIPPSSASSSLASLVQCMGVEDANGGATDDPRGTMVRVDVIQT